MSDKGVSPKFSVEIITFVNRALEYFVQGQIPKQLQKKHDQHSGDTLMPKRLDTLTIQLAAQKRNSKSIQLPPNPYT